MLQQYTIAAVALATLAVLGCWAQRFLKTLDLESQAKAYYKYLEKAAEDSRLAQAPWPSDLDSLFAEATKSLSVVIPAYNEEERLKPTLQETIKYLQKRRDKKGPLFTYEVIVVDDGSMDNTARRVAAFSSEQDSAVRVFKLRRNKGKGFAVRCGILNAKGQNILFMDADGATNILDVEKLEAALSTDRSEGREPCMIVGSRAHLKNEAIAKRHWHRNFLMHAFHILVLLVAGSSIRDTQCGFKLFSRNAAQQLYINQRLQRWCFDVELLFIAQQLKIQVKEVPVNWTEIAGSKIRLTSIVHMSWELVSILLGYRLKIWQLRREPVKFQHVSSQ